jgi:hypothetical protein
VIYCFQILLWKFNLRRFSKGGGGAGSGGGGSGGKRAKGSGKGGGKGAGAKRASEMTSRLLRRQAV